MAGTIIMGYLLILDANRDDIYKNSAEVYIKKISAENKERFNYIKQSDMKDLGLYKAQLLS